MYQINSKEETFQIGGLNPITIKGHSRSAYRTGYLIHPYNIYLDAGHPSPVPPSLILVSHGHYDHIANLYSLLLISEGKNVPVMLPVSTNGNIQKMLDSFASLNNGKKSIYKNWTPINQNTFNINIISKKIIINTYKLDHRVPTQGYGITEVHKKLKEEYKHLNGKELAELKKTTEITFEHNIKMILFISDTGKSVLPKLPFNEYPIVIIECTFFDDEHYDESVKRKHLHWKDLEPYVISNENTRFILGHFSCRYKEEYIKDISNIITEKYKNIIFWI